MGMPIINSPDNGILPVENGDVCAADLFDGVEQIGVLGQANDSARQSAARRELSSLFPNIENKKQIVRSFSVDSLGPNLRSIVRDAALNFSVPLWDSNHRPRTYLEVSRDILELVTNTNMNVRDVSIVVGLFILGSKGKTESSNQSNSDAIQITGGARKITSLDGVRPTGEVFIQAKRGAVVCRLTANVGGTVLGKLDLIVTSRRSKFSAGVAQLANRNGKTRLPTGIIKYKLNDTFSIEGSATPSRSGKPVEFIIKMNMQLGF
jgi:hypothetical protein